MGASGDALRANLGSCVGLCIVRPTRGSFGLCHILLPKPTRDAAEEPANPARFAATAVAYLLSELGIRTERERDQAVAFVAGGSDLYESKHQVGANNRAELLKALAAEGIEIAGRDLGGCEPRQIVVDGARGCVVSVGLGENGRVEEWAIPSWNAGLALRS